MLFVLAIACAEPPEEPGWWASAAGATALRMDHAGCLVPDGVLVDGLWPVLAASDTFALVGGDGTFVDLAEVELLGGPEDLPDAQPAEIVLDGPRWILDADGCALEDGTWLATDDAGAIGRAMGPNYQGFSIVGRDLAMADLRAVEADGWDYPWHGSVQLTVEIPDVGFVIGGGVVVGPQTILTAAHLGVDVGWCYSLEPDTGAADAAGRLVCDNVAGPAEPHPDGVDAAIVRLARPIELPPVPIRATPLEPGEAFFTSQWSALHRNVLADSTIARVSGENAYCASWPEDSTFVSADLVVGPGDSGGPAFVGGELVGLVHGERCHWRPSTVEHVFVNAVPLAGWVGI